MHAVLCVASLLLAPSVQPDAPKQPTSLTIRVTDEAGKPAPDVILGSYAGCDDSAKPDADWRLRFGGSDETHKAGADGTLVLGFQPLFGNLEANVPRPLVAWTSDRSRAAIMEVSPSSLGKTVDVKLEPACRVTVRTTSTALQELGHTLNSSNLYIFYGKHRPIGCRSTTGVHELMLPPGEYRVCTYGRGTYMNFQPLTIAAGEKEKTVASDLPATRLMRLVGKPAPELVKIKGWKNGGPSKIADFKGKVVLLDFWGHWCAPCIGAMPELMELHDTYKDKGLVVIAVHDDSAESIEDMDAKLATRRETFWGERDLPFLVALDGGGDTPIEGHTESASGATTAAYGIDTFPTKVLIDRSGRVIGVMPKGNDGLEMLKKAIDAAP